MRNYLQFAYGAVVVDGMEADDQLAIDLTSLGQSAILVSRDKDLRTVEGWHYSYALGGQQEQEPEYIDRFGYLRLNDKKKLKGGGMCLFFAQCLMGDRVDNIQGIPKMGDVGAYKLLGELSNEKELYEATLAAYKNYYNDEEVAYDAFLENATLLWMIREANPEPVMFKDIWRDGAERN